MGDVTCNSIEYTEGLPCCVNYYQDNNSCLPCLTGSFGFNCTQRCKPGKYGEACLKECVDCAPEDCHYNSGCPKNENVPTTEIEATYISSTLSSSLPSKSVENLVSTPVKVLPTVFSTELSTKFTTKFTPPPNVVIQEQTNILYIVLIPAGVIIFLLFLILLAVLRRLWVIRKHESKNLKNDIEPKRSGNGDEEDDYQEIDIDATMAYHGDVSGNRYNIIKEEIALSRSTKYQEIGPKIDKDGKTTYSHYQELDNENNSSNGNDGGYIEPESRRPTHSYIEVIETMIHTSDPANSDQEGGCSNKSDQLEDYQDTMNIRENDQSCSDDVNESKPHDSSMSDTYLDVVHN